MTVITIGNYKGGVGKTSLTELLTYVFGVKYNYKVLVVDLDPSAQISRRLKKDFNIKERFPTHTFFEAIVENEIDGAIMKVHKNIDIVHGSRDMEYFSKYVYKNFNEEAEHYLFKKIFADVVDEYDYVLIDTKPSTSVETVNAICMSDYHLIASDAKFGGLDASIDEFNFLQAQLEFNPKLDLIGVVALIVENKPEQLNILNQLKDTFNDMFFENYIKSAARILRWSDTGISEEDHWDKVSMQMYQAVAEEALERIKKLEESK